MGLTRVRRGDGGTEVGGSWVLGYKGPWIEGQEDHSKVSEKWGFLWRVAGTKKRTWRSRN